MEIKYYNRSKKSFEIEKVYGDEVISWLYGSKMGQIFSHVASMSFLSKFYGNLQSIKSSAKKIPTFIKNFDIQMDDYVDEEYKSFNQFFIRKFKEGKRSFSSDPAIMSAPCEARYFALKSISEDSLVPVKGKYLLPAQLLNNKKWEETFEGGPLVVARLCPVDYHRFHFPDAGKVLDQYRVHGKLHSVNPVALKFKEDIFATNEREVSILETENFGKIAYVEVGATMVGKIVQSHTGETFKRGEEKGYFLFGGSTVIIIGEKGKWVPESDILNYSKDKIETYLQLGESLARKID